MSDKTVFEGSKSHGLITNKKVFYLCHNPLRLVRLNTCLSLLGDLKYEQFSCLLKGFLELETELFDILQIVIVKICTNKLTTYALNNNEKIR